MYTNNRSYGEMYSLRENSLIGINCFSPDKLLSISSAKNAPENQQKKKFRQDQADAWQEHFNEIVEFKRKHNHCLVPYTYPENPALARWVKRQRYQYKLFHQGETSSMAWDRIKMLEDLGFIWDSHEATWQNMFKELITYKKQCGNCEVPTNHSNSTLYTWINRQRAQYKHYCKGYQSSMTIMRILQLENQGFKWKIRSSKGPRKKFKDTEKKIAIIKEANEVDNFPISENDYIFYKNILHDLSNDHAKELQIS